MAAISCPFPEVENGLSLYIKSRKETLRIRRILAGQLSFSTSPSSQPKDLRHVTMQLPHSSRSATEHITTDSKNRRADYLKSLNSNAEAQSRYNRLRLLMDGALRDDVVDALYQKGVYDHDAAHRYVTLLHQRSRAAALEVIEVSLRKLLDVHSNSTLRNAEAVVREFVGEQPHLPMNRLSSTFRDQNIGTSIFKLKREVLNVKGAMDEACARSGEAHKSSLGATGIDLESQVYALRCARDELVEWVESELAKLHENSEFLEDASPAKIPTLFMDYQDAAPAAEDFLQPYGGYTKSRVALVETIEDLYPTNNAMNPLSLNTARQPAPTEDHRVSMTSTGVLTYLPVLMQTSRNERSLLQESAYLRHQLTSFSENTLQGLLRLSNESHLVIPGKQDISAWVKGALQCEASTRTFTAVRRLEAEQWVETACKDMAALSKRKKAFERLKGNI